MPADRAGPGRPRYAILGAGRWARVLADILAGMGRDAKLLDGVRRREGEADADYRARLADRIAAAGDIVWIAVPPGPHSVV
ncbi:hypothetical protein, partial [Leclercia adecarboxylata]|uniref:hypothetical protein n=1 Tax=Leclercia adecarboxylata TaxID=83655 RepID=UPI00234C78DE